MKNKGIFIFVLVTLTLLAISVSYSAQQSQAVKIQAVRVEKQPQIDGLLTDPVWQKAIPFSDFKMVEPTPGAESTEKTVLRVIYDESNLYLGIYCYDREPQKIAANSLAHDQTGQATGMY
ncbi:MAG: hypothetical protein JHC32_00880, partial [Candidatus Aminicenantes bacterium]|nr:hypothetical protein [Candidatus Aminicenantes bacterium]